MSLDTALAQINSQYQDRMSNAAKETFSSKQAIDNFINGLDKEAAQPLLNATAAALKWDLEAVNKINEYYTWLLNKKTEETYNRSLGYDRLADKQNQWQAADKTMKFAILSDALWDNKFLMDEYAKNPDKYEKMSYEQAVANMMKLASDQWKIVANQQLLTTYISLKAQAKAEKKQWTNIPEMEALIKQAWISEEATHATGEQKLKAMWDQSNMVVWAKEPTQTKQYVISEKEKTVFDAYKKQKKADEAIKKMQDMLKRTIDADAKNKLNAYISYLKQ